MSKKPQVVQFSNSSDLSFGNHQSNLSGLVVKAKDLSISELVLKLNRMLDTADDKLFDMADKSNEVQFFNSMRQVRIKRQGLVNIFKRESLASSCH